MQARADWSRPRARRERLDVGVRTVRRDVERLRTLGYPVHAASGRRRRLPSRRRRLAATAAARRGGGRRCRGGTPHCRERHRHRHRGDRAARAREARGGAPAGVASPCHRGERRRCRTRASARPSTPGSSRSWPPRSATANGCASAIASHAGTVDPPPRRASSARPHRAPLVSRRLGRGPRGLAHVPRRPHRARALAPGRRFRRASHRRGHRGLRRAWDQGRPATAITHACCCTPRSPRSHRESRPPRAHSRPSTSTPACCTRAPTGSVGLAIYVAAIGVDFEVLEPPELTAEIRRLAERFTRAIDGPIVG